MLMSSLAGWAQDANEEDIKSSNQYFGVQANQLIRQLLNFGGSSGVASNPYLLIWSVNSKQTGWGFTSGLGYTHSEVISGDPLNPIRSTINDFSMRIGFEKKRMIGQRWLFSTGIDLVIESSKDVTKNGSQFGSIEITTRTSGFGFGPRVTLNYLISERILIGTEATYYYKSLKSKQEIDGVEQNGDDTLNQLAFSVPAVIYVTLKF